MSNCLKFKKSEKSAKFPLAHCRSERGTRIEHRGEILGERRGVEIRNKYEIHDTVVQINRNG